MGTVLLPLVPLIGSDSFPILFPLNILNISERERTEKIIPVIREMKRKISRNII